MKPKPRRRDPAPPTRWGAAVADLMRERGWSQKRLAAEAGLQENALVNVVRHGGHTTTRTLERLAAALDVDVSELLMTRAQRVDRRERQHHGAGLA